MHLLASIPSPSNGAIELGPLTIHMYGLTLLAAIGFAIWITGTRWVNRGGDWDLIFRGFVDAAFTDTVDIEPGEVNETIWGTGVGVEFQWKRNVLMRLDWGVALSQVGDPNSASDAIRRDSVDKGDNRFHFLFTILY